MSFPYLAKTTLKYKSPHATDLSFAKGDTIRVTGPSPDDEDWLVGETLDGSSSGGFPKDFIEPIEEDAEAAAAAPVPAQPEPIEETQPEPVAPAPVVHEPKAEPEAAAEAPAPPPPAPITAAPPPPAAAPSPAAPAPSSADDSDAPVKQSMKDRLAFFTAAQNKAAAPPPPIKPKPAGGLTWSQRQKLRQEEEAKERAAQGDSVPAPVAPTAAPAAPVPIAESTTESTEAKKEAGMSAADAMSSISKGGSLKERMAALQGAGAFGRGEEEKPAAPKPSGKVWSRPPAPPQPEPEEEGAEAPIDAGEGAREEGGEEGVPVSEGEEDEEEKEKARRAAIAARMAKLGARGPMGMMAPRPAVAPKPTAVSAPAEPAGEVDEATPVDAGEAPVSEPPAAAASAPQSIKMPAVPRRAGPPRRRGPTPAAPAEAEAAEGITLETTTPGGTIEPPPQVMVAGEEDPLPKTEEQIEEEHRAEEAARGPQGAAGAAAAGIAMEPVENDEAGDAEPMVGAVAGADDEERSKGLAVMGAGEIIEAEELVPEEAGEMEEGIEEGGDERDPIMDEAKAGHLVEGGPASPRPQPIAVVPLAPPAEGGDEEDEGEEEDAPPVPPYPTMGGFGKDEVELKHEHDAERAADEAEEEEEAAAPPPPPRSVNRPPVPVTSPASAAPAAPLPPPPTGNAMIPPRDEEDEGEETGEAVEEEEEEEPAPAPPPRRRPSVPVPIQTGLPALAGAGITSPTSPTSARSPPPVPNSPARALPPVAAPVISEPPAESAETDEADEEATRRKGIAARMAKLGGIKFGMPPPMPRRSAPNTDSPTSPVSPGGRGIPAPSPTAAVAEGGSEAAPSQPEAREEPVAAGHDEDETPEQEAARRRATLARLRAGGTLGFGMFSHGHATQEVEQEQHEDTRGIEPSPAVTPLHETPPQMSTQEEEEGDAPPPPPRAVPPPAAPQEEEEDDAPPPPPRPVEAQTSQPRRTPSFGRRPPQNRTSLPPPPILEQPAEITPGGILPASSSDWTISDEPAVMMMQQHDGGDIPPPVPAGRPVAPPPGPPPAAPDSPRRSTSSASRAGYTAGQTPSRQTTRDGGTPTRQTTRDGGPPSRQTTSDGQQPMSPQVAPSRQSTTGAPRPAFNELQEAAATRGIALARAAKGLMDQGKKGNYGDGSPEGFVLLAMERAGLPAPAETWGQIIYEQESESVMKRYDEPRPGDIAAFHDARFKGKKGLTSYSQQVGSVEEPLVGIVLEFDPKNKHKMKVAQVERGVADEVSYRADDLKSGRICVYRP